MTEFLLIVEVMGTSLLYFITELDDSFHVNSSNMSRRPWGDSYNILYLEREAVHKIVNLPKQKPEKVKGRPRDLMDLIKQLFGPSSGLLTTGAQDRIWSLTALL